MTRKGGASSPIQHQRDATISGLEALDHGPSLGRFRRLLTDGFSDNDRDVRARDDDRDWHLIDGEIAGAIQGTYTGADVDPLDVSRDAFLVGG